MFNSYSLTFGESKPLTDEIKEALGDVLCDTILDCDISKGKKRFMKEKQQEIKEALEEFKIPFNKNIAAHILESAFHYANENFYEMFEDGERYMGFDDQYEMQDAFLENLTTILKNLLQKA